MGAISKYLNARGLAGGAGSIYDQTRSEVVEEPQELSDEDKLELAQQRLSQELAKLRGKWKKDDDNDARIKYEAMMGKYASGIDKKFLKEYGIPDDDIDTYSTDTGFGGGSDLSWQEKAVGVVGKAGEYAGRPGQALFRGLQELGIGAYNLQAGQGERKGEGVLQGMWSGLSGRGDPINLREAFGMDKDAGGTLGDVADFAGQVVTDPLNFVSAGTGSLAKAAIRKMGEDVATRGLLDVSGKRLATSLAKMAPEQQSAIRGVVRAGVSPAARGEAGLLRRNLVTLGRGTGDNAAEYITDKTMRQLGRRGRGGFVLAGHTVVPGGKLGEALGWADKVSTAEGDLSKGNLTIQGAANDFATEFRNRPLRTVDTEAPPAFRVNDPDVFDQELDELYEYMTNPEKMGVKVETEAPAYASLDELRADVANGKVKVTAAADSPEAKREAVTGVFGYAMAGSDSDDAAMGYLGQLFSDAAMVADDAPVRMTDEAVPAATPFSDDVPDVGVPGAVDPQTWAARMEELGDTPEVPKLKVEDSRGVLKFAYVVDENGRPYSKGIPKAQAASVKTQLQKALQARGESRGALSKAQENLATKGITGGPASSVIPEQFGKDFSVFITKWVDEAGNPTPELVEYSDEMRASIDKVEAANAGNAEVLADVAEWRKFLDRVEPPAADRLARAEQQLEAAKAAAASEPPTTAPGRPVSDLGDELRTLEEIRAAQSEAADRKWAAVDAGDADGVQKAMDDLEALEMEEQVTIDATRGPGPQASGQEIADLRSEFDDLQEELTELLDTAESGNGGEWVYTRIDEVEDRLTQLDDRIQNGGARRASAEPPREMDLDLSTGERNMLNGGSTGSIHPFYEVTPDGFPDTIFGYNGVMNDEWFDYLVRQNKWDEYLGQLPELKARWQDRLDRIRRGESITPEERAAAKGRVSRNDAELAVAGIDRMEEALTALREQIGQAPAEAVDAVISPRVQAAQAKVDRLRAAAAAEEETARQKQVAAQIEAERAEMSKTVRGRAELAARDKLEQKRIRIVEGKRRRLVKAEEKARKAQAKLDATREKIADRLDETPNTPTFGMGQTMGREGRLADEAAAKAVRADALVERIDRRVKLLERKVERARARLTDTQADLTEADLDAAPVRTGEAPEVPVDLADLREREADLAARAREAQLDPERWEEAVRLDDEAIQMRERIAALEEAGLPERQKIVDVPGTAEATKSEAGGILGAKKPGFRGGRRLGKAEQKVADLEAALKEARSEREAAHLRANDATEVSWEQLDRYNDVVRELRGKGQKPVKGFGEGKTMEKAEARLRAAIKEQAKAESALEEATERWEDIRPALEEGVARRGDRAAREAAFEGRQRLIEQGELGDTVSNTGAAPLRETTLVKRGYRRKLLESRVGGVLNRGVNTRADLRYRPGAEGGRLAASVGDITPQIAGLYQDKLRPVILRMSELIHTAKLDPETLRDMYATLEEGGDAVSLRVNDPSWPPAGRVGSQEAARELLGEMDKVRRDFTQALVDAGIVDEGILNNVDQYVHRTLTEAGRKALGDTARSAEGTWAKAGRYGTDLAQGGALEERAFLADLPIHEIEASPQAALVRKRAGLEEGAKLYEDDPAVQTARRAASAYGAVAEVEFYRMLGQVKTDAGEALMVTARKSDKRGFAAAQRRAARLGYKAVPLSDAADVVAWAPDDLVPELVRMRQVVYNDDNLREIGKFFDAWNKLWKRSATIPLTSGTGFVMRNMQGNIINNYLRGVTSPAVYAQAFHYQRLEKRAARVMAEKGLSFEKALDELGVAGREAELALAARKHGVWSEGFIRADLGEDQLAELAPRTAGQRRRAKLNPLGQNNAPVKYGRAFNEVVENNARMAHFISKFDETGNAIDAARSMRETLFDYTDLTPTEQRLLKRVNAFYTWTRKNLPLQMRTWIESPARQHRVMMAEETFLHGDEEDGDQRFNAFAIDRGQGPAPKWLGNFIGGSNGALVGMDTPTEAALDTLAPLIQAAAVTPGVERLISDDLKPRGGSWSTKAKMIAGSVIGQTSGGPAEALNQLFEYATGADTFTGQQFVTPQGKTVMTKPDALWALTSVLAPGVGKTKNQLTGLVNKDKYADRPTSYTRAMLVRMTIGLGVTPQDERTEKGEAWRRYSEAQEAIAEAFPDGLPTIEELREAGIVPESPTRRRRIGSGSIYG